MSTCQIKGTKQNKTEDLMVDIHRSISLFLFYTDYLQMLGKIE